MSYDLELFQLAPGVTVDQINTFLCSDEYQHYLDQQEGGEECEDEDEEAPSIPVRFINTQLKEETLQHMIFRAWLEVATDEEDRSPAVQEYLDSAENEVPEELEIEFINMFEYAGTPGVQPMLFSYGGNAMCRAMDEVAQILEILQPQRIAAFDPQLEKAVDGSNARSLLRESGKGAQEQFNALIQKVQSEGFMLEDIADGEEEDEDEGEK